MMTRFSRRAFLVAAGAGLVSAPLVWKYGGPRTEPTRKPWPAEVFDKYVDHDGWMLTPADEETLTANPVVTPETP